MAVSGGHTPWLMLRALAADELPWQQVHIAQVDERVAPAADPDRNLAHLRASLLDHAPLPPDHVHAMPVEAADLDRAAAQYALTLRDLAGSPPVLDLIHMRFSRPNPGILARRWRWRRSSTHSGTASCASIRRTRFGRTAIGSCSPTVMPRCCCGRCCTSPAPAP